MKRGIDIANYIGQFEIIKEEVGGIDFSVWKIQMKARSNSTDQVKFYPDLNMEIRVSASAKDSISNEVKRAGFLIDRGSRVELRPGDSVILYVSMGGFEK